MKSSLRIHARSQWFIACALGASLGLAACGDRRSQETPAGDSASASEIDACELVTSVEAAEALGVPEVNEEPDRSASAAVRQASCLYSAERGQGLAVLHVMARQGYSQAEATTGFEGMKEAYAEMELVDVPDVGDRAFWIEDLRQLWVLTGQLQLGISGDISGEQARELASGALQRLE
jgi:hypothetical protein